MPNPFLARLSAAYAALGGASPDVVDVKNAPDGPMARYRPDLYRRERLSGGSATDGGGFAVERYVENATIYQTYVWVRKAATVITTAVSPLPRRVVDSAGRAVLNHPLTKLLEKPNTEMDGAEWVEIIVTDKLLGGEWFSEIVTDARGRAAELWPRRPDEVWIEPDPAFAGYPVPLSYQIPLLKPPTVPASHMIHEMFHNPLNAWRGISVIGAVRQEIAVDLLTLQNTQRALSDGSREYAISLDEALMPDERERVERQLEARYGRHRPLVLEAGQSIQSFSSAPDDLQWLEARDYAREGVGAMFGVPDEIMGFGKDTYENFDTAYRVLWRLTLKPLTDRLDSTLTHKFRSYGLAPNERIQTDLSSVEVLQEGLGPKIEQAERLWSMGVPYNTVESQLKLGTGPIPGGDVGYVPSSMTPVGSSQEGV